MLLRLFLSFGICAAPHLLAAQTQSGSAPTRVTKALGGVATFEVPVGWRAVRAGEADMAFAYRVPNPAGDSIPGTTTNVLLNLESLSVRRPFVAYTDSVLSQWITRDMIILDDRTAGHQRTVFWRGHAQKIVFMGFDNLAEVNGAWVHVRIILPLVGSSEPWSRNFSAEAAALLKSIRVHNRQAFPADFGYPVLSAFQPNC